MSATEWPFTILGRRFFDGQLPQLIRNIGRLASELKRYNDDNDQREVLRRLMAYSLGDIDYEWSGLTDQEKEAFGDEKTFERFLVWLGHKKEG